MTLFNINNKSALLKINKSTRNTPKKLLLSLTLALSTSLCNVGMASSLPNDDWLHVEGNQILDAQGNKVWLTGANWFGFNTSERVLHGLWSVNLENTIDAIAARGINLLRVPISTELLHEWQNGVTTVAQINTYTNPGLNGASTLEVFDALVNASRNAGLKILLDVHGADADNMGHIYPMWYKGEFTDEVFYSTWEWVTERYKNDDTIIAFDLENEPHGKPWADNEFAKWDNSTDVNNWKYACETAANRILDINPNMLIMCEGIESYPKDGMNWDGTSDSDFHNNWWGGNLRPVKDFPIDLGDRQSQFMYSPHDYGPLVFQQPWFYPGFNKDTLYQDVWKDNWMFIHEDNISPLLIGEWGGFMDGGDNEKWMIAMQELILEYGLHHTFWCINPNSGDTGGLLDNSWVTWDEEKYAILEPTLWKNNAGKFIGLDHQIPLGSSTTGISLKEHYGDINSPEPIEPSVNIQSPQSGSNVNTGSTITLTYGLLQANSVNVYVNSQLVGSGSASSATITVPNATGAFTVVLKAVNAQGQELSATASVMLNAINEVISQPSIDIVQPTTGTSITAGSELNVMIDLQEASGFAYQLGDQSGQVIGTQALLTAPSTTGDYILNVTALDENNQALTVTDEITLTVEPAITDSALSCEIGRTDTWNAGFVINDITITNTGTTSISAWSIALNFANNTSFVNGWGGQYTQSGQNVTVTNMPYNGQLAPGQSTSIGLQGEKSAEFQAPTCSTQ